MQLSEQGVESLMTRIEDALAEGFCLTTPRSQFLRSMHHRMKMSAHGLCITQTQLENLERYLPAAVAG